MERGNINEKIVLVGGGGGVYRIARFLKFIRPNITTIQTVFDSGGHSGALRDEHGVLPPGDIRRAILALADEHVAHNLRELLSYRFASEKELELEGVNMGNLLLTALTTITGSLPQAINEMCMWYGVKGKVLPVSLDNAHIKVKLSDGTYLLGEKYIDTREIDDDRRITDVMLEPKAHIYVEAYEELVTADKIIFCPGDLYTSLLPNLLVEGFAEALSKTEAQIIYPANIMTKKAETDGFSVADFVRVIESHMGGRNIDTVIVNDEHIPGETRDLYQKQKAYPVTFDGALENMDTKVIKKPLVDIGGGMIRHHERIAGIIAEL